TFRIAQPLWKIRGIGIQQQLGRRQRTCRDDDRSRVQSPLALRTPIEVDDGVDFLFGTIPLQTERMRAEQELEVRRAAQFADDGREAVERRTASRDEPSVPGRERDGGKAMPELACMRRDALPVRRQAASVRDV